MLKIRKPSPAMVIALVALFAALGGSAIGATAVPLAKRALTADNAKKLGGKTLAQVAATPGPATTLGGQTATDIAATPGPASSIAALLTIKTAPWSLAASQFNFFSVACDTGQKVVGGGYDNPVGDALGFDDAPGTDGASWRVGIASSSQGAASGTVYAICAR